MRGVIPAPQGTRLLRPVLAAILIVTLFLALTPPPPVLSASYEVTTIVDSVLEEGSLRWAVKQANDSVGVPDTISFAPSVTGIIPLSGGAIPITDDLTITGPGAATLTVSGDDKSRVFSIGSNAVVEISGLTIADGRSANGEDGYPPEDGEDGGGILAEGGTQLTLTGCVLRDNATGNGGAGLGNAQGGRGGNGGAIASEGALTLSGCTLRSNQTGNGGSSSYDGGNGGNGGAIACVGTLSLNRCTFEDNYTGDGGPSTDGDGGQGGDGGAVHASGPASIASCRLYDNYAGTGGLADGDDKSCGNGGGGGALLLDAGDFEIVGCLFESNEAGDGGTATSDGALGGPGGGGGGIASLEGTSLTLRDCTLTSNMAGDGGSQSAGFFGQHGGDGGGLSGHGDCLIESCLFAGNQAGDGGSNSSGVLGSMGGDGGYGGGLNCLGWETVILQTTVEGNRAGNGATGATGGDGGGGGGLARAGPLTMKDCTFSGNHAGVGGPLDSNAAAGGGILLVGGSPPSDTATLVNCTITGNYGPSDGGDAGGGGLVICDIYCHLSHCTISDNTAVQGGGLFVYPTGLPVSPLLLLKNTIVANNNADTAPDIYDVAWEEGSTAGGVVSYGCNLLGEEDGFSLVHASGAPGDIIGADPMLESLDDNGGPTKTMALRSGSPAIDAVESGRCRTIDGNSVGEDQRGENRPADGNGDGTVLCDIGAYEAPEPLQNEEHEKRPPTPASMSTCYMALGSYQALPGQAVQVSVNVCNGGEVKGSQTVVLSVNGLAEQDQTLAVSGGSCKTVVFSVAKSVPGTYDVDVNGMHGQFTVLAPRIIQASVPYQQDTGLGTAGIIAIVAVVIVLILGLVVVFRQS